ncbi:MAG: hypothetical protein F9K47_17780 [Burkholderiales bacterium]|nr:MAG: hypothetical protein F9K47_17780 [Burkholderiales bacterium]
MILWHAGDFVANGAAFNRRDPNFDHRQTWRAAEPLGYCGLVRADLEVLQRAAVTLHQDRLTATRPQETYLTPRPGGPTASIFDPFPE